MPNKIISNIKSCVLITAASLSFVGCVSTVRMTPQEAASIKTIEVSEQVTKPDGMWYGGPGASFFGLGAVGGLITGLANIPGAKEGDKTAHQGGVEITEIVRNEVINQLKQNGQFKIANKEYANAVLRLDILMYGLSVPNGFSTKLRPVLSVVGKLVGPNGKVMWQDKESIFSLSSGMPEFGKNEILQNPHNMYLAWDAAAKAVSQKLIQSMVK